MTEINELIKELFGTSLQDALLFFLLIFTRWITMSMIMPFFGALLLPSMLRIAFAFLLALISFLTLMPIPTIENNMAAIVPLFLKEGILGLIFGLLSSLVIYAYQMMGDLVDYFRAANMSRLLIPETKCHTSPLGVFMSQLALVIFLGLGLHREVIKAALLSFHWFPVFSNEVKLEDNLLHISLDLGGKLLYTSLRLSMPILTIILLFDLGFGLLNRIAPQINVYFLSLPAKMIGALIMLFIVFPLIVSEFLTCHHEFFSIWHKILPLKF